MQIILSPAKKMIRNQESFAQTTTPRLLEQTKKVLAAMQELSYDEAKAMWNTSENIARPNFAALRDFDLSHRVTPAITSYVGIVFQYMAPDLFTQSAIEYVAANLRILSGFYGVLRPFDGVVPYRLSLDSPISVAGQKNLYDFWDDALYQQLDFSSGPIVNLASKEYSKAITSYLQPTDRFVEIVFGSEVEGKIKTKATYAKMARGAMVRFMAENNIQEISDIKLFDHPAYEFQESLSDVDKLVFLERKS